MLDNTIDKRTTRIGFLGLGLMGSRLTRRLHSSGWNIQAWNRSPDPAQWLGRDGMEIPSSIVQLVAESEVILSSFGRRRGGSLRVLRQRWGLFYVNAWNHYS